MGTPARALVGRDEEYRRLAALAAGAAAGAGGVLVVRGEAGIGKSALLDHLRRTAREVRILEASGSEWEAELPFAALHQMCVPLLGGLNGLSAAHRTALKTAFGAGDGAPEIFRIGMAVLELLATAAETRPLLCLVDDAH